MSKVYLVITQTGSIVATAIKLVTKKEYNHVSIAFDEDLDSMYSFGRKWPHNPFIGVFVVEKINSGTYKRFSDTRCMVVEFPVTKKQYELLRSNVDEFVEHKEIYKYNVLGLFLAALDIEFHQNNKFYCSEFVKYVMENSDIDVSILPKITQPTDFLNLEKTNVIYEGLLNEYNKKLIKKRV